MATAAGAKITTIAGFPEHIFLETLAVRADGSILVSALNREHRGTSPPPPTRCRSIRSWCVPSPGSPKAGCPCSAHLPHTGAATMKFSAQFATSRHFPDRSDTECARTTPNSAQRQLAEKRTAHQHVRHTTRNWRIN
jgi:hypothetical protein